VLAADLRSIARNPRMEIRHGRSYTLYPGRVHIEDLQIGDRDGRRFRLWIERADLRVDVVQLLVGKLRITGLEAAVRAIGGGVDFTGDSHLTETDAGALLDVAGLPAAARWALEGLDGQPFTIDAAISRRGDAVALDAVRLGSAGFEVRGAYHWRGDLRRGAFLVRRGRVTTGIVLEGDRVDVVLAPEDGWLSRHLDAMDGH
jgi:hypothetical protein